MKKLCNGTQCGEFQFLLILDLWGISFHAVVVFGLGKNLLSKFVLTSRTLWGRQGRGIFYSDFLNVFKKYNTLFFMEFSEHSFAKLYTEFQQSRE